MTNQPEREDQEPTQRPTRKTNWKGWLGIAVFIVFIIGINIEKYSKEGKARSDAAWRGAAHQVGQDVCDAYQWSQAPETCEELSKEARERAERRFEVYQK